jgi:hypothetical protein
MVMSHSSMASSLRTRGCRTQRPRGDDADVRPHPSDADVDAGTSTRASARDNTNIGAAAVGRETQELNDNNRSECETDAEDDTAPKCRICYGTVEPSSGLRTFASPSPCDCKGSSAYVHLYCLQRCVCVCVCVCVFLRWHHFNQSHCSLLSVVGWVHAFTADSSNGKQMAYGSGWGWHGRMHGVWSSVPWSP